MSVIAFENWSLRASTLNAWVGPNTHEALQKIIHQYHTEQKNWGAPFMKRNLFFEYTVPVNGIKPCPAVDGWYFTLDIPGLETHSFALLFAQRKQNPRYPIQSREEIDLLLHV